MLLISTLAVDIILRAGLELKAKCDDGSTKTFTIVQNDEDQMAAMDMDGAAIKVCLKADGAIVACSTDLRLVIAATLEFIIAHVEKAGKDGSLDGDGKLAAASAFLLAVADLNEIEKATGLGAADTAHLRLCKLLMNTRLQGTDMNELTPTLRILMYISGSANITGITNRLPPPAFPQDFNH